MTTRLGAGDLARWDRIAIVGASGTGKTRLAKALSTAFGLSHVSVDELRWPRGTTASDDEVGIALRRATSGERWVVEGVDMAPPLQQVWQRADALLWLDHSRPGIFARFARGASWGRRYDWPAGASRRTYAAYLFRKALRSWRQAGRMRRSLPPVIDGLRADGVDVQRLRSSIHTRRLRAEVWRQGHGAGWIGVDEAST